MAAKLDSLPQPQDYKIEKPIPPFISGQTKLQDLVSSESYFLFDITGTDSSWLQKSPSAWPSEMGFVQMKEIIFGIASVNTVAEQKMSMLKQYAGCITKDPKRKSEFYQVNDMVKQKRGARVTKTKMNEAVLE
jgi:hypothetical protein